MKFFRVLLTSFVIFSVLYLHSSQQIHAQDVILVPSISPSPVTSPLLQNTPQPGVPVASPEFEVLQTQQIVGKVLRREGNVLTLETDAGIWTVDVVEGVSTRRNGREVAAQQIQPGDTVTAVQSSNGKVLSIEARSARVFPPLLWVLSLLLIGAVGLALLFAILRRGQTSHIKTNAK